MPGNPRIRASDADRDRTAALLQEHYAAGRLTTDEIHERLSQAMEAKTLGDLDALMTDLPHLDLSAPAGRPGGPPVGLPAGPSQAGQVGVQDTVLRIGAVAVIVAGYLVAGAVFGIWWIPWYLVVFVVLAVVRSHRQH